MCEKGNNKVTFTRNSKARPTFKMASSAMHTPKKTGICGSENTPEPTGSRKMDLGSQRKDPWSRSSPRRFSGHGSIYNAGRASSSTTANTTPSKQQSSSLSQRYATPAERMSGLTPTRAFSSTFASSTNRFAGKTPGSLYGAAAAGVPDAGEYNPVTADKIKGVVKLQAVVRRRQSRGIFAMQEKLARQVTSPGKYEPATLMGAAAGGGGLSRTPRFVGQVSIYSAHPTPDAGSYAPPIVLPAAGGGSSFAHGAHGLRFQGEGSIYPTAQASLRLQPSPLAPHPSPLVSTPRVHPSPHRADARCRRVLGPRA